MVAGHLRRPVELAGLDRLDEAGAGLWRHGDVTGAKAEFARKGAAAHRSGVAKSATSRRPVWVGGVLSPQSRRVRCSITGTKTPSTRWVCGFSQFTCRSCNATAEAVLQARTTSPQPSANSRSTPAIVRL